MDQRCEGERDEFVAVSAVELILKFHPGTEKSFIKKCNCFSVTVHLTAYSYFSKNDQGSVMFIMKHFHCESEWEINKQTKIRKSDCMILVCILLHKIKIKLQQASKTCVPHRPVPYFYPPFVTCINGSYLNWLSV